MQNQSHFLGTLYMSGVEALINSFISRKLLDNVLMKNKLEESTCPLSLEGGERMGMACWSSPLDD